MFEKILNEVAKVLPNYKNGIEVNLLFKYLVRDGVIKKYEVPIILSDFVALLDGDKRFEIISLNEDDNIVNDDEIEGDELFEREKLNVDLTQIVKLKTSIEDDEDDLPSLAHTEEIADKMKKIKSKLIKSKKKNKSNKRSKK